uniref:Uncharacterized protein n=1 Tax=Arundo donax TaxID=35708 RepID=A0A0A9B0A6_ARUDO
MFGFAEMKSVSLPVYRLDSWLQLTIFLFILSYHVYHISHLLYYHETYTIIFSDLNFRTIQCGQRNSRLFCL